MNPAAVLAQLLPPAGPPSATGRPGAPGPALGGDRDGSGQETMAGFDFKALMEADPEAAEALSRHLDIDLAEATTDPDALLKALLNALAIAEQAAAGGVAAGDEAPIGDGDDAVDPEDLLAAALDALADAGIAVDGEDGETDPAAAATPADAAGMVDDPAAALAAAAGAAAAGPAGSGQATGDGAARGGAAVTARDLAAPTAAAANGTTPDGADAVVAKPDRTADKAAADTPRRAERLLATGFVGTPDAAKEALADARPTQPSPAVQAGRDALAALRAAGGGDGRTGGQAGDDRPATGHTNTPTGATAGPAAAGPERAAAGSFRTALDGLRAPTAPPTEQVAVQIRQAVATGGNHVTIRLQPATLGQVDVHLEIADDRLVQARVVVDKSETLDLLRRDSAQLERALSNAGLQTDTGGLNFSLRGQQHGQGFAQNQGGNGAPAGDGMPDDGPDDALLADIRDFGVRPGGWTADGRLDLTI